MLGNLYSWFGSGFIYAQPNLNLYGNTQQKEGWA